MTSGSSRTQAPCHWRRRSPENRRGVFERGGWALPLFDDEASAFVDQVYQRADAFLFGRRTYEMFAGTWGAIAEMRAHPIGVAHRCAVSESRSFKTTDIGPAAPPLPGGAGRVLDFAPNFAPNAFDSPWFVSVRCRPARIHGIADLQR